ncbi:alpha-amylase family glycosyl hydrolase [Polaribacter glomeratus]|uniref:Alpha-amlyase n=1 Tax=Polaribacter glomeratus TaxID=102 RepID=A0A2S7WV86_9FLAO|nr:alpha-amylase family glycosyl hydrolase [Polaribacter glomeratus]PQJ81519.1 alpha-amlyase [Polaribacter glomeratus]TXD64650.1 T9SS type A sorting domain-containing protein [Polaribacter glomeratus]
MKKITLLVLLCITSFGFSQVQNVTFNVSPATFEETNTITITVSNVTTASWGVSDIYLWAWSYDENDINSIDSPTNGTWTNSNETQKLINNGNGTFSITFKPTSLYNRTNIGSIGMLIKAKNGTGDKKSQDQIYQVGAFQLTLNSPTNTTSILNSGETLPISAATSLPANFNLKANGSSINQKTNLTTYSFSPTITQNTTFVLEATNNGQTVSKTFNAIVKPTNVEAAVPAGMKDGLNLNPTDNTKATLVFYAPNKEFIHVIGSFNNWEINNTYLLKKDTAKNRFWIELTGLSPQTDYTYQYIINADLRVADPYSTIVLTENNDQYINATTYPNLPSYPAGKTNHAVTLLRTGDASYAWQNTNFQKPKKTDLVIYELLIRDFDALHSFDAVKNRLNYLQELGVNAIEFMPVNEFDGNESWGYNPSFHMALDKYYGNIASFKQLIDECHKRGIAVILDVVYNHASGQNPYYRMYNTDNGGYGGQASADSPFFNQTATHSYSVFNDLNHSKQATKDYIKRVSQYWIDEFKIDGFRWDLTKGFTQNCTANDEGCTGNYQADRVAILKGYADNQWEIDSNFYVIFEHLGGNTEELEWVNYRLSEGKGIMLWGNQNYNYRQAAAGNTSQSNFSNVSYKNRNWPVPANISYMESHDEERLMVESLTAGKATSTYNIKTLATALKRQELAGAFYFTVPGPKMIWQFGELGYDFSIDYNGRIGNKPIKWDYFEVQERKNVYNTWNKLIQLKLKYDIFETSDFTIDLANTNGLKKIQLTSTAAADIQYINIIGNFGITTQNINPVFQKTGTWYDVLNNNQTINVSNTNSLISLAPGEFKIYANTAATLSNDDLFLNDDIVVYPNPVRSSFKVNIATNNIIIYDVNGKKIKEFSGDFNANSSFSVKGIKRGFYLLKASNKEGKSYKKLIIE